MHSLAEKGVFTVLVTMPGNLAVLDMNAADGICEQYPEIESWYMAGHSLGGSMAASYISENADNFDVDLTNLSSTMVYSEVYNMMSTPENYIGKTVSKLL